MILQALTRYYDILVADPDSDVAPPGYTKTGVSFALDISLVGKLQAIIPLYDLVIRGKKTVEAPQRMVVPEQVKRSVNILPNFLCDNSAYALGLSGKEAKDADYASKRFEAFRKWNIELLAKADCDEARAVIAFLLAYDPHDGAQNPLIAEKLVEIQAGGNLVFRVDGQVVHKNGKIQQVWEAYKAKGSEYVGQCLVTGEKAPIARLHPSLKGIREANATGATLVGFNAPAYESYNRIKGQGLNSPVSEKAAFAYTTTLNYLLSAENESKKFVIGDTTVVYWAESKQKAYANAFMSLFEPEVEESAPEANEETAARDKKAENDLKEVAQKVQHVKALDIQGMLDQLDGTTRFFILGLAPNAARISVRFFHSDPFEKIVQRLMAHYDDLQIEREYDNQPRYISLRRIVDETIPKKAKEAKAPPLLIGAMFRSILNNAPYPAALYSAMISRIRADHEINYTRAAVIKAFLIRKYRNQSQISIQEVLSMPLNEQATTPAYLLGRLFAVLEKAQKDAAAPAKLNATIRDRYFTSACATPASVFPVLLRLAQHHISKAEYGYYNDQRIEAIMKRLDIENNPFPAHLTLDEQGIFMLGYYHQRADFYAAKNGASEAKTIETENQVD